MKQGIVIKVDASMGVVYDKEENKSYLCHAQGKVKANNGIIIGDNVEFEKADEDSWIIKKVFERKNELQRPKISNVDNVFIVCSTVKPDLDTFIIDKYLMYLELKNIDPILLFTKVDLLKESDQRESIQEKINWYSKMGYKTMELDNTNPDKKVLEQIEELTKNKLSIFTGQTGAGKSTTINNYLDEELQLNTQEISEVLNRGKHTTTNVQIHVLNNEALVADTPGFSSFDLNFYDNNQLAWAYRAFDKYRNECKFKDCVHDKEIGCAVKQAVEENKIPKFFYEDYLQLLNANKKKGDQRW